MSRVIHFEIHALDPQQIINFYQDIFQWQFQKWEGPEEYWMISTGEANTPGINGGLIKRKGPAPIDGSAVNGFVNTITVDNIDNIADKILTKGGKIALAKKAIPSIGWVAYFKDFDGNIFGIFQSDVNAK